MIEVKNVTKEFEKTINKNEIIKFKADDDISFTAKEGEVISRATGYGLKSMSDLKKSLKYQQKAEKARYKIAKNKYYRDKMQRKLSQISKEDLKGAYAFVKNLK